MAKEPGAQTCQWVALHSIAEGLRDPPAPAQLDAFRQYVRSLVSLIPCGCKARLARELEPSSPLGEMLQGVDSREDAVLFVHSLHNSVNARLGKKELSLEQARAQQARWRRSNLTQLAHENWAKPRPTTSNVGAYVLGFLLLALLILLIVSLLRRKT